jgi:hypothetical protein
LDRIAEEHEAAVQDRDRLQDNLANITPYSDASLAAAGPSEVNQKIDQLTARIHELEAQQREMEQMFGGTVISPPDYNTSTMTGMEVPSTARRTSLAGIVSGQ